MVIVVTVVAIILIFVMIVYNKALSWRFKVENSLGQIDIQLKAKGELIPNLVEAAKRYATHEADLFQKVAEARTELINSASVPDAVKADGILKSDVNRIFALSESYPDLKSDQVFVKLQEQIVEIENKVALYRQFYNDTVMLYNRYIESFPNNIILKFFKFKGKDYLKFDVID